MQKIHKKAFEKVYKGKVKSKMTYKPWNQRSTWSKRTYIAKKKAKSTTSGIGILALLAAGYFILRDWKMNVGDSDGFGSGDINIDVPGDKSLGDALSDLFNGGDSGGTPINATDVGTAAVELPLWVADRGIEASLGGLQAGWDWGYKKGRTFGQNLKAPWDIGFVKSSYSAGYKFGDILKDFRSSYNEAWFAGKDDFVRNIPIANPVITPGIVSIAAPLQSVSSSRSRSSGSKGRLKVPVQPTPVRIESGVTDAGTPYTKRVY